MIEQWFEDQKTQEYIETLLLTAKLMGYSIDISYGHTYQRKIVHIDFEKNDYIIELDISFYKSKEILIEITSGRYTTGVDDNIFRDATAINYIKILKKAMELL